MSQKVAHYFGANGIYHGKYVALNEIRNDMLNVLRSQMERVNG